MKVTYILDTDITAESIDELVSKLFGPAANYKSMAPLKIRMRPLIQTFNGNTKIDLQLEISTVEDNSY